MVPFICYLNYSFPWAPGYCRMRGDSYKCPGSPKLPNTDPLAVRSLFFHPLDPRTMPYPRRGSQTRHLTSLSLPSSPCALVLPPGARTTMCHTPRLLGVCLQPGPCHACAQASSRCREAWGGRAVIERRLGGGWRPQGTRGLQMARNP